jgi:hypothetical protein
LQPGAKVSITMYLMSRFRARNEPRLLTRFT